jgi:pyruvate dehydrogenase E2 component (dihydrolipoamide acetyltransferase)
MSGVITPITMPKWGLTMTEGMVAEWYAAPGAVIKAGQEIMEIETTKITNVYESPSEGQLRRLVAQLGATVPVGGLLAVLADNSVDEAEIDAFIAKFQAEFVSEASGTTEATVATAVIETGPHRLRYLRLGPRGGVPLLLVHGFGADLNTWMFNQPALAEHYDTIALDLPGHGGSSKTIGTSPWTALLDALVGFMNAADFLQAHLVGHSLGGALSLALAGAHPERVASLTLIAPGGLGPEINMGFIDGLSRAQRRKEVKDALEQLVADPSTISRSMVEDVLKYKRVDGVAEALTSIAAALFPGGRQAGNLRETLEQAAMPRQLLWGREDRIIPASHAEALPDGIAVHLIDGAGHLPHMEKSSEVNRLVLNSLRARVG